MKIKQISVFLENRAGRLAKVTQVLKEGNVNIRALSIADTSDFGILRMIVDHTDKAYEILKANDFTVSSTDVIAVAIEDKPGGLGKILAVLNNVGINLEYVYAFLGKSGQKAVMICRVERPDDAIKALQKANIQVLDMLTLDHI